MGCPNAQMMLIVMILTIILMTISLLLEIYNRVDYDDHYCRNIKGDNNTNERCNYTTKRRKTTIRTS